MISLSDGSISEKRPTITPKPAPYNSHQSAPKVHVLPFTGGHVRYIPIVRAVHTCAVARYSAISTWKTNQPYREQLILHTKLQYLRPPYTRYI